MYRDTGVDQYPQTRGGLRVGYFWVDNFTHGKAIKSPALLSQIL
jgi:hypothetical protein